MLGTERFYIFNQNGLVNIPLAPTSVEEQIEESDGIIIAPNPTSTSFTISGIVGVSSVNVVNNLGIMVCHQSSVVSGRCEVDVSNLPSGVYFVQFRMATGIITKPIIVTH